MFSIFWKSLFVSMLFFFMWINIAFAFNVLTIMNPTSVNLGDASEYYFGVSSFIEQFKTYFSDNSVLQGFQDWLRRFGVHIQSYYDQYVKGFNAFFGATGAGFEVLSMLFALFMFTFNITPMVMMILMGVMYIIYLLFFAFEIALFIIAFFGGAFATPLPSTDWWVYTPTNALINLATIV